MPQLFRLCSFVSVNRTFQSSFRSFLCFLLLSSTFLAYKVPILPQFPSLQPTYIQWTSGPISRWRPSGAAETFAPTLALFVMYIPVVASSRLRLAAVVVSSTVLRLTSHIFLPHSSPRGNSGAQSTPGPLRAEWLVDAVLPCKGFPHTSNDAVDASSLRPNSTALIVERVLCHIQKKMDLSRAASKMAAALLLQDQGVR